MICLFIDMYQIEEITFFSLFDMHIIASGVSYQIDFRLIYDKYGGV